MRRGFTVAELGVVTTLIGLLAAILFPVFARAREHTRAVCCRAILLNIFVALRIYATDTHGALPPGLRGPETLVGRNLLSDATLRCPSAPGDLHFPAERTSQEEPSYVYIPGLKYAARHELLVADARPRHLGNANGLFADGSICTLTPSEWLSAIPRPVAEAAGIVAPVTKPEAQGR
ncbi:MAG: type II secretion system protein [Armatimonadetes bacterium]|nr:type II secretion system protein [Armatimonadota bacterium]